MSFLKYLQPKNSVKRRILNIQDGIKKLVKPKCTEMFNVTWYGAYDIDPKHLVYWVCVESDKLKKQLNNDSLLNEGLRALLDKNDYPNDARRFVHIGFESQETVNRESGGNWYHHFK